MDPMFAQIAFGTALVGNGLLWISFLNRSHGLGIWRPLVHGCSALALIGFVGGPFIVAAAFALVWPANFAWLPSWFIGPLSAVADSRFGLLPATYTVCCLALSAILCAVWLVSRLSRRMPAQLLADNFTSSRLAPADQEPGWARCGVWKFATSFSTNEVFRLDVTEKELALANLPAYFNGLTIAHLSDLHMSGSASRPAIFGAVVDRTNELQPDLVAITGDIVDAAACLSWISKTLGRLVAPYGVYYVLGNHDRKVDLRRVAISAR